MSELANLVKPQGLEVDGRTHGLSPGSDERSSRLSRKHIQESRQGEEALGDRNKIAPESCGRVACHNDVISPPEACGCRFGGSSGNLPARIGSYIGCQSRVFIWGERGE